MMSAYSLIFRQIVNEIEIHRSLNYSYVVGFRGFFEDDKNVYILLELCSRKVSVLDNL